jgi:integrase
MKGHLRRRGDTWAIVFDLRGADGKRRRKWHSFRGTKRQAQAELTRLLGEINQAEYVEPSKQTVAAFLDKWLTHVEAHVARKTFERYGEIASTHLTTAFGTIQLSKLSAADIDATYSRWLKSGRRHGQGGLSPQTIIHHHRVLRQALSQAVKWGLIARNVADSVDPPRRVRPEIRALDESQLAKLLKHAEGTRLVAPIYFAIVSGVRRGELVALQWSDLNVEAGTISVRRSTEQTKDGIATKTPKSGKSRSISLARETLEVLRKHRVAQNTERLRAGDSYQNIDLIFPREDGSAWEPELFGKAFSVVAKGAAIGHVRLHDLRHACASLMLKSGVHAKVVSERLGHSTISITLDTYSHVLPGLQEAAADKLDYLLETARRNMSR